jgi:hypothetical protein
MQHGAEAAADWTKFYSRVMGFYDRVALSRVLKWTAFSDRGAARVSVDALLGHSFDGLIVGHGTPLVQAGRDAVALATAWLPVAPPRLPARPQRGALFSPKPCG